jgi:hypothetical protein
MTEQSVTLASRCEECDGALRPRPHTLCEEHREARRKQQQRERARRYRRRRQGHAEVDGLTLSGEEVSALRDLTTALLAREDDLRAWSQAERRDNREVPEPVKRYFATGVRVRRALSRLTDR